MKWVGCTVLVLVVLFLFLPEQSPFPDERRTNVSHTMENLVSAIKNFQADYGHYPRSRADGRYETAEDNARLMNVLRAVDTTENPNKTAYFDFKYADLRNGSYQG